MQGNKQQTEYQPGFERALLVGANLNHEKGFDKSMEELASLAEACQMEVIGTVVQNISAIHKGLYIGTGKVKEIKEIAQEKGADMIVFDQTISPMQLRNLGQELDLPVMDRTGLILDIFAKRAQTREAKLQVEVAKLQYMLPRLIGINASLSRQGGGGGGGSSSGGTLSNRGSGEKKLELDRRTIEVTLNALKKELEEVDKEKVTQRKLRKQSGIPRVALVGYTNAGKSTLMNQMVRIYLDAEDKLVLEKNMLFATLETTVRKITVEKNKDFLLSDTVGFINKLPHGLIKAFRSTLDEVKEADLLLMVVDYSDEDYENQLKVTEETLEELGAADIPRLYVYNKVDLREDAGTEFQMTEQGIFLSAKNTDMVKTLCKLILEKVYSDYVDCNMLIPFDKGQILGYLNQSAQISNTEYVEEGSLLRLRCSMSDYQKYQQYVVEER